MTIRTVVDTTVVYLIGHDANREAHQAATELFKALGHVIGNTDVTLSVKADRIEVREVLEVETLEAGSN